MKQFEYKLTKWLPIETLQGQLDHFSELGSQGWQVFHLHETILSGVATMLIYSVREKPVNDLARENNELRRKLVAAVIIGKLNWKENHSFDADLISIGMHNCPTSPIGVCAYEDDEDPSHEDCVFCHEPNERK